MSQEWEDHFQKDERKLYRKIRKEASQKDRSKFKKTDQDQIKNRLTDQDLLPRGRILKITPEGILVDIEGKRLVCSLKGSLKQETSRLKNLIAIGDFVRLYETTIVSIDKRTSILSRADNLSRNKEQLIAVNIDQLIISTSILLPPLKPFLVDRYIIAAQKGNLSPIIVINKTDLLSSPPDLIDKVKVEEEKALYEKFVNNYKKLNIPLIAVSCTTGEGIDTLKNAMRGKTSVFSGQSGVGKSSLINAVTGTDLRTGFIVDRTSKGAHTTTSAELLPLEGGGFCIDTPGIKSFGIWLISRSEVRDYFSEIAESGQMCQYPDCLHMQEPNCAVIKAVETGEISALRFASYCALMESVTKKHQNR